CDHRGEHEDQPDVRQLQHERGRLPVQLDERQHDHEVDQQLERPRQSIQVALPGGTAFGCGCHYGFVSASSECRISPRLHGGWYLTSKTASPSVNPTVSRATTM